MEFAGVGLRAYDIALILETILFHVFCQFHRGNHDRVKALHKMLHLAVNTYSHEVKARLDSSATDPGFVEQVCGLVGCEQLWRSVEFIVTVLNTALNNFKIEYGRTGFDCDSLIIVRFRVYIGIAVIIPRN